MTGMFDADWTPDLFWKIFSLKKNIQTSHLPGQQDLYDPVILHLRTYLKDKL